MRKIDADIASMTDAEKVRYLIDCIAKMTPDQRRSALSKLRGARYTAEVQRRKRRDGLVC